MADEKPAENQEKQETLEKQETQKPAAKPATSLLPWIILAVAVLACAGAGFGLGKLFAGGGKPAAEKQAEHPAKSVAEELTSKEPAAHEDVWYFDLEPVVANLDEPGATRYVQATLTVEVSGEMDPEKGAAFMELKKPLLTNWLAIYLASLNLERTRGEKNLQRIQSEICEGFNEKLFPDSKPFIKRILIKAFAIQ